MRNTSTPTIAFASCLTTALLLTACGGGGGGGSSTPPPANTPPVANAGPDQTVDAGVMVTLDGSGSADADGTISGYTWTQTGGSPAVTLSSRTVVRPTFDAPAVTATTTLTFSLVVRDNRNANSNTATVGVTINPPVAGTVSGRVRFTRIPTTANAGLNYGNQQLQPARGVTVRALAAGTAALLGTTSTDDNGDYSFNIAAGTNVNLVVDAEMVRGAPQPLPRWNFSVRDAEMGDAINPAVYSYNDPVTVSSDNGVGHNIDIPSGISTTGTITGTRASAPFAILDTIFKGKALVLGAAPTTLFPDLVIDWASNNLGGVTYFDRGASPQLIVLSGEPTEDTDEFDQHVIAHEFGHYIEANYSRADNIGGQHGLGDRLDIRVAFGEGFGYAFGAMALGDPVSVDTFVFNGNNVSSTFDVDDNPPTPNDDEGCWCSESSVWSVLWDLYDSNVDPNDAVALGFTPLWNVLTSEQRTTPAFTSLFSFITAVKAANPAQAANIDTLVVAQNTSIITDIWGTNETRFPSTVAAAAALPLYTDITINGPAVQVLNVDDAGTYNTLGSRRYLRFTVNSQTDLTITANSSNPSVDKDTDFIVWRNGEVVALGFGPKEENPETETIENAEPGTYIIDVYDCANGCDSDQGTSSMPGDYTITVTVTSP
jgi:hypothetical protein